MIRTSSIQTPANAVENAAEAAMSNYSVELSTDKVAKALLVARDNFFEVAFMREGSASTERASFISLKDKSHKLTLAESEFLMNLEPLIAELRVENTRRQLSIAKSAMRAATKSLDDRLNNSLTKKREIQVAELNPESLVIYDCIGTNDSTGKSFSYVRIGGSPEFQTQPNGKVFLTITSKEFLEYFIDEPASEPEAETPAPAPEPEPEAAAAPATRSRGRRSNK